MKRLVRDANGNVGKFYSIDGILPDGWIEIPAEELETETLKLAKIEKLNELRNKRDALLLENDRQWLILSKKGESTKKLEDEAQRLRDLPDEVEKKLNRMRSLEKIKSYDAFKDSDVEEVD